MLTRLAAGFLGVFHMVNGLVMLLAPQRWYALAPGAAHTGPFNPHFVEDAGLGFLAGGLAFLAFAWRPQLKLAALGASGFVVFHALLHVWGMMNGDTGHVAALLAAVALPAFLGLALVWPRKGDSYA